MSMWRKSSTVRSLAQAILLLFWSAMTGWGSEPKGSSSHGTNIFAPASTPAKSIADLSVFVLVVTGIIFIVVFVLLVYSVVKFRGRARDAGREPAQVYGSTQIEVAWTIIPILIVVVLFLATARVIHAIQDAPEPAGAVQVTVIGHQYWWEFRYPRLGIVTANELHIPVSDPGHPIPTFLRCSRPIPTTAFGCPSLQARPTSFPTTPTECGWIRNTRVSFLASVPSTVGPSTRKCCYVFPWMEQRILPPGFEPSRHPQSKTQAQSQVGGCLKAMPA